MISVFQDYFKLQPEGFRLEDVYICESRYAARNKSFKKIKVWAMPVTSVRFVPRDVPLPVVRVLSMYAKHDQEKPVVVPHIDSGSVVIKVRKCRISQAILRDILVSHCHILSVVIRVCVSISCP